MFIDKPSQTIDCKQGAVRCVRFNAGGEYALTCGSDRTLKLWNPAKQLLLRAYPGHSDEVVDCRGREDNGQIASCSRDKSLIIWDVATAKIVRRFRNLAPFTCVYYGHDSAVILAGSTDGTAKIYDLKAANNWEAIQCLGDAADCINSIQVHGHCIMTASSDSCLREYDLRKGLMLVDRYNASINCSVISKDGLCYVVSCLDGTLWMIDRQAGQVLAEYRGHKNRLYKTESVLVKNDSMIVSGSEDGQIYCWDVVDKIVKQRLEVNHNPFSVINSIDYSRISGQLLSSCGQKIQLWNPLETLDSQ